MTVRLLDELGHRVFIAFIVENRGSSKMREQAIRSRARHAEKRR